MAKVFVPLKALNLLKGLATETARRALAYAQKIVKKYRLRYKYRNLPEKNLEKIWISAIIKTKKIKSFFKLKNTWPPKNCSPAKNPKKNTVTKKPTINLSPEENSILSHFDVQICRTFEDAIDTPTQMRAQKISEGSYGYVFASEVKDERRIFKMISLKNVINSANEIACSKPLDTLNKPDNTIFAPNFPTLFKISVVKGSFPFNLIKTTLEYSRRFHKAEEMCNPGLFRTPNESYLIIESSHCGIPINRNHLKNPWVAVSIITQIVSSIAAAEDAFDFEHRDLHFGNLLVQKFEGRLRYTNCEDVYYVKSVGLKLYIIDFTYSKIRLDDNLFYLSLNGIEAAVKKIEYPDPWRKNDIVYLKMAEIANGRWHLKMHYTNILWIKHVIERIRNLMDFAQNKEEGPEALMLLNVWSDRILNFESAKHALNDLILNNNRLVVKTSKV